MRAAYYNEIEPFACELAAQFVAAFIEALGV